MAWTEEQQAAISEAGQNILVSAGAGSGKTAVLTARVKRILLSGVSVNRLLVLTFTNAAAQEMKERIRKTILETPSLAKEAPLLEEAFITTFDAFALAIVKKYHTRLNITNRIQITDDVIVEMQMRKLLDEILEEKYLSPRKNFQKLIHDFCLKDDQEIKDSLLKIYQKIELKYDKTEYLKEYLSSQMNEEKVASFVSEYLQLLLEKQKLLQDTMVSLQEYFDGDFLWKLEENFHPFLNATSYDEFVKGKEYKSITVPRGCEEEGKALKQKAFDIASSIRDLCMYESEKEMVQEYLSTKDFVEVFLEILLELDKRLDDYKRKEDIYTFTDVSRFAIQLVKEQEDIREELSNQFYEILVDEYQDTSDTQEMFLSYISHDNLYMVGDIKQSIYRFRNANPYIFKQKYDDYRQNNGGLKIDLMKNFRSRREVLDNVNLLFDFVMDESLGGASYQEGHRMIFGNMDYEKEGATEQNYQMEILTYDPSKLGKISSQEEEAFMIGNDILKKINEHYMVFERDQKILRPIEYRDFVILLDKSKDFDLYKKVFEYLHIPFSILKDESLKKDEDILIIRNLFRFLICLKEKRMDAEFRYTFFSVARSFLFQMSDSELYDLFIENRFSESTLYQLGMELVSQMDTMNLSRFLLLVLDTVHYEEKLITIGNIESFQVRIEYLYQLCCQYEKQGKTVFDFVLYLQELFDGDYDLRFHVSNDHGNSCQIMTIHKSKGLEFPICYFASFASRFNLSELKEKILFDPYYGFIFPKVEEAYKDTFVKILLKNRTRREEISEKIRLLYVAVTRAKEKIVVVIPKQEETKEVFGVLPLSERESYLSFLSIFKSIYSSLLPYVQERDILVTKDYLNTRNLEINLNTDVDSLVVEEIEMKPEVVFKKRYSKEKKAIIDRDEKQQMNFGTRIHEVLAELDFFHGSLDSFSLPPFWEEKVLAFLHSSFIQKYRDGRFYKEYEFLWEEGETVSHGVIDLLIEMPDEYIIVDYKLKNIMEEDYDQQLNGYRRYIEHKTNKKVSCYLYSIIDENYREVCHD